MIQNKRHANDGDASERREHKGGEKTYEIRRKKKGRAEERGRKGVQSRIQTYLGRQRIRKLDIVHVVSFQAQSIGNVNRSGRAGLVLEASQVGLDLVAVYPELGLVWERNILYATVVARTEHHDPVRLVVDASLCNGAVA
jgi:hypothetical protein